MVGLTVIVEHCLCKDGEVAGGADLTAVRQARRVDEPCVLKTEALGLDCHQLGEPGLGATKTLGDNDGDIIGRLGDEGANCIADGD